jgi:osmotically-inducible protein OsmY
MTELKWDEAVNATKIGVEAIGGVVTLLGHVGKFSQEWSAERAAQKVCGVKALAVEIDVVLQSSSGRSDTDIARTAEDILEWTTNWPKNHVKVLLESGWVTLSGKVDYEHQRELASSAVCHLMGVTGVSNQTTIKPILPSSNVKADIQATLKRLALKDAEEIIVTVDCGKKTLNGVEHSWSERDMVSDSVWNTAGVTDVSDNISVAY